MKLKIFSVPPKLAPFHASVVLLNVGDRASITCSVVKGDTPLTITWRKDGRSLDPAHRVQVTQVDQYNSILVIESLQADHTGNYSCVVSNMAAEVEGTQGLLVNGKINKVTLSSQTNFFTNTSLLFQHMLMVLFLCVFSCII